MPNTVTNFYNFTAGTAARSSEVNNNFTQFRGTIVPVHPSTATSADNTYDLGSSEYYWATVYGATLRHRGVTTTSYTQVKNTQSTLGGMEWLYGTTTLGVMTVGAFGFAGHTSTEFVKFQFQTIAGGKIDLLSGTTTLSTWDTTGLVQSSIQVRRYTSSSAGIGQILLTGSTTVSYSASTIGNSTVCSARITTRGGGVISFQIVNERIVINGATTTASDIGFVVNRGSTTSSMTQIYSNAMPYSTNNSRPTIFGQIVDTTYTAGEVVYELIMTRNNTTSGSCTFTGAMMVYEM